MESLNFLSPSFLIQGLIMSVCIGFGIFLIAKDNYQAFSNNGHSPSTGTEKEIENYFDNLGKFLSSFVGSIFGSVNKFIPASLQFNLPNQNPDVDAASKGNAFSGVLKFLIFLLLFFTVNILTGIISNTLANHWINSSELYHFGFKKLWVSEDYRSHKGELKDKIWHKTFCDFFDIEPDDTQFNKVAFHVKDTVTQHIQKIHCDTNQDKSLRCDTSITSSKIVFFARDTFIWSKINYNNLDTFKGSLEKNPLYLTNIDAKDIIITSDNKIFKFRMRYFIYMLQKISADATMKKDIDTRIEHINFLQVFSMSFMWLFVLAFINMAIIWIRNMSMVLSEIDDYKKADEQDKTRLRKLKFSLILTWLIFALILASAIFGPVRLIICDEFKLKEMDYSSFIQIACFILAAILMYFASKTPVKTNFVSVLTTLLVIAFSFTCYFWSCKAWLHSQTDFVEYVVSSYKVVDDKNMPQDLRDLYDNTY